MCIRDRIWTTLPPEVLPTATVMGLYRLRWQVELAIKRLKSILNIDQLRAKKNSALADLYLHGKLLYAWVVEKRLRRRGGHDGQRLDQPRRATPWRLVKLVQRELTEAIQAAGQWNLSRCCLLYTSNVYKRQGRMVSRHDRRYAAECAPTVELEPEYHPADCVPEIEPQTAVAA